MAELISYAPATGEPVWRGETGDVDAEVASARGAWARWAAEPLAVRIEAMRRFANAVRAQSDPLATLTAHETGKPLWEARGEIDAVIARIDTSIAGYAERSGQRRIEAAMGGRAALRHKPHGVLAVITPFSAPLETPAARIIPALIAGNAVVFKPSEKAAGSGAMLAECFHAAGVPEGCMRLVIGGAAEGKALADHAGIDGLLFTGSARTGFLLARAFTNKPDRMLALEMGGNNPILVWDTPDLATAAVIVVQSAFAGAGQRCTAARRLIVEERLFDPLIEAITKLTVRLIVGAPDDQPAPFMGPLIDEDAAEQLSESFIALLMRGGRPICHLERPVAGRPFVTPALIDITAMTDRPDIELYGPLLQVSRVDDFDAAIAEANATRYGLCASLISQTPDLYNRFWAASRAGIINWNRPTSGAVGGPAGGIGWSGNNRPGGTYAADHCAYPVSSSEADAARAAIGIGLRDG